MFPLNFRCGMKVAVEKDWSTMLTMNSGRFSKDAKDEGDASDHHNSGPVSLVGATASYSLQAVHEFALVQWNMAPRFDYMLAYKFV